MSRVLHGCATKSEAIFRAIRHSQVSSKEPLVAPRHQPQDGCEVEEGRLFCRRELVSFVVKTPSTYRTTGREDETPESHGAK
jgi:hypothetical protein